MDPAFLRKTQETSSSGGYPTYLLFQPAIPTALPSILALIRADASGTGWGAVIYFQKGRQMLAQGKWSSLERQQSNNARELTAILRASEHFLPLVSSPGTLQVLHVQSDNTTAIATRAKMGNLHSQHLNLLAIEIAKIARTHSVVLKPRFIEGALNSTADELSRKTFTLSDCRLNPMLFDQINSLLGPLQIDLFASEATAQLPLFCAWAIQPAAWRIDAMSFSWKDLKGLWAYPPFALIARILQKISVEKVDHLVIMAPVWTAPSSQRAGNIFFSSPYSISS